MQRHQKWDREAEQCSQEYQCSDAAESDVVQGDEVTSVVASRNGAEINAKGRAGRPVDILDQVASSVDRRRSPVAQGQGAKTSLSELGFENFCSPFDSDDTGEASPLDSGLSRGSNATPSSTVF